MRFDKFLEPISEDDPCGPDLDLEGDVAYFGFMSEGTAALPKPFYDTKTGAPFERASIDISTFQKTSASLLERSRDIRLLVLEARLQASAGKLVPFCECVLAVDAFLETFWESVHPGADGDLGMRAAELANFNHRPTCVLPLEYAPIFTDRRFGPVSLRAYVLATKADTPRTGESAGDPSAIERSIANDDNADAVKEAADMLLATRAAMGRIVSRFSEKVPDEPPPDFDIVGQVIDRIIALIEQAKPGAAPPPVPTAVELAQAEAASYAPAAPGINAKASHAIPSHAAARAALQAAERYFLSREPSNPALLLVHQSRLLIGKTLSDALDTLMPSRSSRARFRFGPANAFEIGMEAIRNLSVSTLGSAPDGDAAEIPEYRADERAKAYDLVMSVEQYLRSAEPTSPIPFLLQKAQSLGNRDFAGVVGDIFEKEQ